MNDRPIIIVTGSSGLVGSGLVSYFSQLGFQVRAFQRTVPTVRNPLVTYYTFDLADVQDRGFADADYVIHCAYRPIISRRDRESGVNVDIEGTKRIIALSRKHDIRMIFLSSLSAHPGAESYYGKNKLLAESLFDTQRDLILRLGIVLGGRGGLFGKITTSLRKFKIVPLIGGGMQHAQTIALDDLCRIIERGIAQRITGHFAIAHPSIITMHELYQGIAGRIGAKPLFVPVPLSVAYHLTALIERGGLSLPFTAQSILGLKDLQTATTAPDLAAFGLSIKDCQTTLQQLPLHGGINEQTPCKEK